MRIKNPDGKNQWSPKTTFWRTIRDQTSYSNQQIADAVGLSKGGNIPTYLSGAMLPSKPLAQKFCKLFGVPYDVGEAEFIKAREEYLREHPGKACDNPCSCREMAQSRNKKTTFWEELRDKYKFTTETLAPRIGKSQSMVSNYMTGRHMPSDDVILKFCEVFDLPFETAKAKFVESHDKFHSDHTKNKPAEISKDDTGNVEDTKPEAAPINCVDSQEEIRKLLYQTVSFEIYNDAEILLRRHKYYALMEYLYNKIDFDLHYKIQIILQNMMA